MKKAKFGGTGWWRGEFHKHSCWKGTASFVLCFRRVRSTSMSLWIIFTRQSGQPFINFANQIWSNWGIFHSKSNSFYTSEGRLKRKLSSVVSWGKERDEWLKSQIQTSPQILVLNAGAVWIHFWQALERQLGTMPSNMKDIKKSSLCQ